MGLSSNIVWHQTKYPYFLEILRSKEFLCSYSQEIIKWRKSELKVAFPMISFCDLPLADMYEFLKKNHFDELHGKYGNCTIGLSFEWAKKMGMTHVWYHYEDSEFLKRTLPSKKDLLKSLQSKRFPNRWEILSRSKPFMGDLPIKDFQNYRFYDEREIRYIPSFKYLLKNGLDRVKTEDQYLLYKKSRIPFSLNKEEGDSIIPEISIKFDYKDIKYILVAEEKLKEKIFKILGSNANHIILKSYTEIVEEIIGIHHYSKAGDNYVKS